MKILSILSITLLFLSCAPTEKVVIKDINNKKDIYVETEDVRDSLEVNIPLTFKIINNSGTSILSDVEFKQKTKKYGERPILGFLNGILYSAYNPEKRKLAPHSQKVFTYYFRKRIPKKALKTFDTTQIPKAIDSIKRPYRYINGNSQDAAFLYHSIENDSMAFTFSNKGHIFIRVKKIGDNRYFTITEQELMKYPKGSIYNRQSMEH